MFSSEDRHGTWMTVLTRACARRQLFAGKALAAAALAAQTVALLAISSLAAGVVLIGHQPLVGLSGSLIGPGRAAVLVVASWLVVILPVLGFASLAALLSVATRNGIVGVLGTLVAALTMQLLGLVGTGTWVHALLLSSAFDGWHALFTTQPCYSQLLIGSIVSLAWIVACLGTAWALLRRRDFAGAATGRRAGWGTSMRIVLAFGALTAALALAGSWGPVGVTATRLTSSIGPTFDNLTLLQQRLLGHPVGPASIGASSRTAAGARVQASGRATTGSARSMR